MENVQYDQSAPRWGSDPHWRMVPQWSTGLASAFCKPVFSRGCKTDFDEGKSSLRSSCLTSVFVTMATLYMSPSC